MGFDQRTNLGSGKELLKEDLFTWTSSDSQHYKQIIDAWVGVAKVAANELKRTLKNTTLVMNMWLDPRLKTGGQIDALFAKHDKAIEKINKDSKEIMDSICKGEACAEADMMMMLANPAAWITMKVRDNVKTVTPARIDYFFDETGLNDVPIIGGMMQWTAKKAVAAGQIATLTTHEYGSDGGTTGGGTGPDAPDAKPRGLIDRLYGIFLLQNPMSEHHWLGDNLLTEETAFRALLEQDEKKEDEDEDEDKEKDESDEFQTLLISIGVNEEMKAKLGDPFVAAHREFTEELVTHLEDSTEDAVAMAKAKTLDDFLKVFANAKSPELKSIDVSKIEEELKSAAQKVISNQKALTEFLEAGGKTLEDFGIKSPEKSEKLKEQDKPEEEPGPPAEEKPEETAEEKPDTKEKADEEPKEISDDLKNELASNEKLFKFVMQGLYDQNVAEERQKVFEGIGELFESGWLYILNGLDEDKLDDLRGTPTGDQLYQIITTGRDRLKVIFDDLKETQ